MKCNVPPAGNSFLILPEVVVVELVEGEGEVEEEGGEEGEGVGASVGSGVGGEGVGEGVGEGAVAQSYWASRNMLDCSSDMAETCVGVKEKIKGQLKRKNKLKK